MLVCEPAGSEQGFLRFDRIQQRSDHGAERRRSNRAEINLETKSLNDQEQVWASYANQMAQATSQLGNVLANPYSDAYDAEGGTDAWQAMADAATSVWDNPGISDEILDWEGWLQPKQERLNFSILAENGPRPGMSEEPTARPEGSTLKSW